MRTVIFLSCLVFDEFMARSGAGPGPVGPTKPGKNPTSWSSRIRRRKPRKMPRKSWTGPCRSAMARRSATIPATACSRAIARRHRLTIRFYDADGTLIGRAERVSQAATQYFAADGSYLGRRINQRLVTAPAVTDYNRFLVAPNQPDGGTP